MKVRLVLFMAVAFGLFAAHGFPQFVPPEPQCSRECNGRTIPCSTPCEEDTQIAPSGGADNTGDETGDDADDDDVIDNDPSDVPTQTDEDDVPAVPQQPQQRFDRGNTRSLDAYRVELYKVQADQRKIQERFGEVVREFSDIGTKTQQIINDNWAKLPRTVLDGVVEFTAARDIITKTTRKAYYLTQAVMDYPETMETDDLCKLIGQAIEYLSLHYETFDRLYRRIEYFKPAIDVGQEYLFMRRLPELEIECRALMLDAQDAKVRQRDLLQMIEAERWRIHTVSGTPLEQLPATPLRPSGLGSYVPPVYPTGASLAKARQGR